MFARPPGVHRAHLSRAPPRAFAAVSKRYPPQLCRAKFHMAAANTVLRPLEAGDFHKGFLTLLGQLTDVGGCDEAAFLQRLDQLRENADAYKILVIEDLDKQRLIASATLLVELKFIHGCAKCGHVEDVVVDSSCRGMRLGARIVDALVAAAKDAGCYKVILDCSEDNVPFYEKCGLARKGAQMARYF